VAENVEQVFEAKGPDAKADGMMLENGFLVRAGGLARKAVVPSAGNSVQNTQRRLLAEGVLDDKGKSLFFLQDYTFDTPSGNDAIQQEP
jgi:5-methylcytosine-specific restriction protein B